MGEDSSLSKFHSHFLYNKEMKNTTLTLNLFFSEPTHIVILKWYKTKSTVVQKLRIFNQIIFNCLTSFIVHIL